MERSYNDQAIKILSGTVGPTESVMVSDRAFGRIEFPSAMTGTKLLISSRNEGGLWVPCNNGGVQLEIAFVASSSERIPDAAFGASELRFVSDANEAADRTFYVHVQS